MGDFIRRGKSRVALYMAASFIYLINLVGTYIVSIYFLKINFIKDTLEALKKAFEQSIELMKAFGQGNANLTIEQVEDTFKLLEILVPSLFIITSFVAVFVIQLVCFPIVKRLGVKVDNWGELHTFSFPKSILWYNVIAMVIAYLFHIEKGSLGFSILLNTILILQWCMVVQGMVFLFFLAKRYELPKATPIIMTVLTFIFPFLLSIVWILGIIDLGYDLKKILVKK